MYWIVILFIGMTHPIVTVMDQVKAELTRIEDQKINFKAEGSTD